MTSSDENHLTLVSLQDLRTGTDAVEAHVAFGVLVGPDLAILVLPAAVERSEPAAVEVLLATDDGDGAVRTERIRPRHLEIVSLAGSPDIKVGLVTLSHPSRFATWAPKRITHEGGIELLSRTQDLIASMDAIGIPWFSAADNVLSERLSKANEAEQARLKTLVRETESWTPEQIAFCWNSPNSHPHHPPRDDPFPDIRPDGSY